MPSALASVDSAQSTQAEENLSCSENLENADGDSQDDCGSSDFDSDSDDLKEVIPNETSVQEKPSLLGKSGFVGAGVETDDKFRVKFDSELKKYKDAKMRFLLSLVHDNKPTTSGDDGNTLDKVYSLFGNEIIILRALDNVDNKLKNGTSKEKKKRDRSQRVKSRSRTSSRETALEVPSDTDRSRTQSENDQYLPASGEEPALPAAAETEVQSFSQTVLQHEQISTQDGKDTTAERFQFEEHVSPEWEAERERRAKFRKMYRWERFQFGRFALEAQAFELLKTDIHPSTHLLTKQERRDKIGDSLFKEERRSNVCYIDAKDVEIDKQVLPIITSSNYFKVVTSEPPQKTTSIEQGIVKSDKAESETPSVKKSPASVVKVESEEVNTKGKKDKKKKKRRSSSSSDDLEELERKSEARLGIRK